jgi:hypothetical protein
VRILLVLASPWYHEVHSHGQSVLEADRSIQSALLTTEVVAFQTVGSLDAAVGS